MSSYTTRHWVFICSPPTNHEFVVGLCLFDSFSSGLFTEHTGQDFQHKGGISITYDVYFIVEIVTRKSADISTDKLSADFSISSGGRRKAAKDF